MRRPLRLLLLLLLHFSLALPLEVLSKNEVSCHGGDGRVYLNLD